MRKKDTERNREKQKEGGRQKEEAIRLALGGGKERAKEAKRDGGET